MSWPRRLSVSAFLLASATPVLLMIWYVSTSGGAQFHDDYAFYIPALVRMWNEGVTVRALLDASPHGPHFTALPLLFRVVAMKIGHWDAFIEVYASLVIGLGRVLLLYMIAGTVLVLWWQRLAVLVVASWLLFGPAQVGIYAYGDTGLTMGLDSLGFLLGLWGVLRFRARWWGVALAVAGGFISSWSWGVLATWLVLVPALVFSRFTFAQTCTAVLAALVVHVPIVTFAGAMASGAPYDFFNLQLVFGALGRPFVPDVMDIGYQPLANAAGGAGALLAIAFTMMLGHLRKWNYSAVRDLLPFVAIMAHAGLYIYQASLIRTTIGAWYISIASMFWVALFAMAVLLSQELRGQRKGVVLRWSALSFLCVCLVFFVRANASFEEKSPFLLSRSLSGESCQRNYLTAPTYCEMLTFFWPPTYEATRFSHFFKATGLAAFGTRQTWALQGDFVLDAVRPSVSQGPVKLSWIDSLDPRAAAVSWRSHKRLNLRLPARQGVQWRVSMPPNTENAVLAAKVHNRATAPAELVVTVASDLGTTRKSFPLKAGRAERLAIDVAQHAGRELVIGLESFSESTGDGVILEYPRIELQVKRQPERRIDLDAVKWEPENVQRLPSSTADAAHSLVELELPRTEIPWGSVHENQLVLKPSVCAGDALSLQLAIGLPREADVRFMNVALGMRAPNGDYSVREVQLPLVQDPGVHTYAVDLKLATLQPEHKIETVHLYGLSRGSSDEAKSALVSMPLARLVRRAGGPSCQH
jgi:hypothetical protein